MPEYVYKPLPTGGYTSLRVDSAVQKAKKIAEGWSVTPPQVVQSQSEPFEVPEPDGKVVVEAPTRRGRRPKAEVVN